MSTLDLIRTLRRTLNSVRDAHDESAVAELAQALIEELNGNLGAAYISHDGLVADSVLLDSDEIHDGGMAVYG